MDKTTLSDIISDLKAKRDALSLAHEQLKVDNDNWNKCIIVLSLLTGMIESTKIRMGWDGDVFALMPILLSSIIATISALIKFKKFPERMETLIQSVSLLTNTLNKCRNHTEISNDIINEYNNALEKLEISIYPDIRKKFLRISHNNLIEIMKQEQKYFEKIDTINKNEVPVMSEESDIFTSEKKEIKGIFGNFQDKLISKKKIIKEQLKDKKEDLEDDLANLKNDIKSSHMEISIKKDDDDLDV